MHSSYHQCVNNLSEFLRLETADVDAVLFHLWFCLLFLQEDVFGELSHRSLSSDAVARVLCSVDGYCGSVTGHCAQTRQVQDFHIWVIVTWEKTWDKDRNKYHGWRWIRIDSMWHLHEKTSHSNRKGHKRKKINPRL